MMASVAKICFVEDDSTILELVTEKLRSRGYDVATYEACEPLLGQKIEQFDLYLVDVMLKGKKTGLDLCQDLRTRSLTVLCKSSPRQRGGFQQRSGGRVTAGGSGNSQLGVPSDGGCR